MVWVLSLLLLTLPYTQLLKATVTCASELPCHEQTAGHQHQAKEACCDQSVNSACHCCQLQAPASIVITHPLRLVQDDMASVAAVQVVVGVPSPPLTPRYRPPIKTTS
jgi:hypothetical protein